MTATLSSVSVAVPAPDGEQLATALAAIADVETPTWYPVEPDGRTCAVPFDGGGEVIVYEVGAGAAPRSLTVGVSDADGVIARLTAAGYTVRPPLWTEAGSLTVAGVLIRLWQKRPDQRR